MYCYSLSTATVVMVLVVEVVVDADVMKECKGLLQQHPRPDSSEEPFLPQSEGEKERKGEMERENGNNSSQLLGEPCRPCVY